MRECVRDGLTDSLEHGIRQVRHPVVDPETIASRVNESAASKVREMARGLGLRDFQALVDVAHTDLAGQKQPENPQARGIRQCLEEGFQFQ
jgi:hypothetical protein